MGIEYDAVGGLGECIDLDSIDSRVSRELRDDYIEILEK